MIKARCNSTSLSANINTVFPVFMLDCLQMHCNTEKGRLEHWAQSVPGLSTSASAASVAHRVMGTTLQLRAGATIMTWKANPGQDFEWEKLWPKTWDEQSGRRMYNYSEWEWNTVWATRMSKPDNYQEFTEVLVQSWDGLCLSREGVVEEPEIHSRLRAVMAENLLEF